MDNIASKEILFINATNIRKNIQLVIVSAKETRVCIMTAAQVAIPYRETLYLTVVSSKKLKGIEKSEKFHTVNGQQTFGLKLKLR